MKFLCYGQHRIRLLWHSPHESRGHSTSENKGPPGAWWWEIFAKVYSIKGGGGGLYRPGQPNLDFHSTYAFCRSGASEASVGTTLYNRTIKRFSDW